MLDTQGLLRIQVNAACCGCGTADIQGKTLACTAC